MLERGVPNRRGPAGRQDPGDEILTRPWFEALIRDPIEAFLTSNGLVDQIRIIVLAKGVPPRIAGLCTLNETYLRDCVRAATGG